MKATIKIVYLCTAIVVASLLAGGCSYNELPPKTDDATTTYTLPKGVIPTADESAEAKAIREEYNNYLVQ